MIRTILFTTIGFLLLIFTFMAISYDTFTSIIPGWRTTIMDTKIILSLFYLWIAIILIIYYLLYRKKIKINSTLYFLHIALTLPIIIIAISLSCVQFDQDSIFKFSDVTRFLLLSIPLYLIGQVLFLYQLAKVYPKKKPNLNS